jgi:hypothetical protein
MVNVWKRVLELLKTLLSMEIVEFESELAEQIKGTCNFMYRMNDSLKKWKF